MEFIEKDDADVWQRTILLEPAQEDAFGYEADACAEAGLIIEANLIADLLPELAIALPSDACCDCACGYAPRLKHDNALFAGESRVEQHLGNLGGFAGACGSDKDGTIPARERVEDVVVNLPDWKSSLRHGLYS